MKMANKNKERLLQKVQDAISTLQKNFECPICLDLMKNPVSTKCDHKFCRMCIHEAIGRKATAPCPLCKEPFTKRSLQSLPKWNKIVTSVRNLSEAFQRDTGVLYSPSKQAQSLFTATKLTSMAELFSAESSKGQREENSDGCLGECSSADQPVHEKGSTSKLSLMFPENGGKGNNPGKSKSDVKMLSDARCGDGNVRRTRSRRSLLSDDAAETTNHHRRTRSNYELSSSVDIILATKPSRNENRTIQPRAGGNLDISLPADLSVEGTIDEVGSVRTLNKKDDVAVTTNNLLNRSSNAEVVLVEVNTEEQQVNADSNELPLMASSTKRAVVKVKKSRHFEDLPLVMDSQSSQVDVPKSNGPVPVGLARTYSSRSAVPPEDQITVIEEVADVFPKRVSYGRRRTRSAFAYSDNVMRVTRRKRESSYNTSIGNGKQKSRHSDPGRPFVVVTEAVVHHVGHSMTTNVNDSASFVPVHDGDINMTLAPAQKKAKAANVTGHTNSKDQGVISSLTHDRSSGQTDKNVLSCTVVAQTTDSVSFVSDSDTKANAAPMIRKTKTRKPANKHKVQSQNITVEAAETIPDGVVHNEQIQCDGPANSDIKIVLPVVARKTRSKTRSNPGGTGDHLSVVPQPAEKSHNVTVNGTMVNISDGKAPSNTNEVLDLTDLDNHASKDQIVETASSCHMFGEEELQLKLGEQSLDVEQSIPASNQSQIGLTQNRIFKYKGRVVTPKRKPKKSMIGTPTSDDPYSFKPSQKTPAKKKRGRKSKAKKQIVSFADEIDQPLSQCYELFATPVLTKSQVQQPKRRKLPKKQKNSTQSDLEVSEPVPDNQTKCSDNADKHDKAIVEDQLQELIDKISQAEDFELIMSQQLRELEKQGNKDRQMEDDQHPLEVEDTKDSCNGDVTNSFVDAEVKDNCGPNSINNETDEGPATGDVMDQHTKAPSLCQEKHEHEVEVIRETDPKVPETSVRKPKRLKNSSVTLQPTDAKKAHSWNSAASMKKDLAPRMKSLDLKTKQTSTGKAKRKRKKKRKPSDETKYTTSSSDEDERPQIVDMSPALLTASQQQWLVPRCVDSDNDFDQFNSKNQKNAEHHDSDTDSLGVHPLPHEFETVEESANQEDNSKMSDETTTNTTQNPKSTEVPLSTAVVEASVVPETPMVPFNVADSVKQLLAKVSEEIIRQGAEGTENPIENDKERRCISRQAQSVPEMIDLYENSWAAPEETENPELCTLEKEASVAEIAENCGNNDYQNMLLVPQTEEDTRRPKGTDEDLASSGDIVCPTLDDGDNVHTVGDSGAKSNQSDVIVSPTAPVNPQQAAKCNKSCLLIRQKAHDLKKVSSPDVGSGSGQSDVVISPTCDLDNRRSRRKSRSNLSNSDTSNQMDNNLICNSTALKEDESLDKLSDKKVSTARSNNSSQSDDVISPTSHNQEEPKAVPKCLVAETVDIVPPTLEIEDEFVEQLPSAPETEIAYLIPPTLEPEVDIVIPPVQTGSVFGSQAGPSAQESKDGHAMKTEESGDDKMSVQEITVVQKSPSTAMTTGEAELVSPEGSADQVSSSKSAIATRRMKRRTFSLKPNVNEKQGNEKTIRTEEFIYQESAPVVTEQESASSPKRSKQNTYSKDLINTIGGDGSVMQSRAGLGNSKTTPEGSIQLLTEIDPISEFCQASDDVIILEESSKKDQAKVTSKEDCDDIQVVSVTSAADTAEESTEDPNADKQRSSGSPQISLSTQKSAETEPSRTVSSSDGISATSEASVSILEDNPDLYRTESGVVNKGDDKQEKRLSGSKRSRTPSSSSSESDSEIESLAKRPRSGICIVRGLAARIKMVTGSSNVSSTTYTGTASGKSLTSSRQVLPQDSDASATTCKSTNPADCDKMEVPEESEESIDGATAESDVLFGAETIDPNSMHEETEDDMQVVESDAELDKGDAGDGKTKDEVKQNRRASLEETEKDHEEERETELVPPTPPKKPAEETTAKTPGSRLLNRHLSITMEHLLGTEKKSNKRKTPPRKQKSSPTQNVEASESLLGSATKRRTETENQPTCFAFEEETETEHPVPFIQTVDNDIFTADDEEETLDPNSPHRDHEDNAAGVVAETAVAVSSDEEEPVRRGRKKSRARTISDDSDASSHHSDTETEQTFNGTSSSVLSASFSVHSELLSSQHEANMKEDIAKIQDEIRRLEEHLAKVNKQASKDKQKYVVNEASASVSKDDHRMMSVSATEDQDESPDDEMPPMYYNETDIVPDSGGKQDPQGSGVNTVADEDGNKDTETDANEESKTDQVDEHIPSPTPPEMPDLPSTSDFPNTEAPSLSVAILSQDGIVERQLASCSQETQNLISPSQRVKVELDIQGGRHKKLTNLRSPLVPIGPSTINAGKKKSLMSPKPNTAVRPSPSTPVTPLSRIKTEQTMTPADSDCLDLPQRPSWVITTSGIKKMKIKTRIEKFVKLVGCKLAGKFSRNTTHVIVAQDEDGDDPLMCQRTLKYFQGVAGGRWVLSHTWIVESLSKGQILPPDDYEIYGDLVHGKHQAPRHARLSVSPLMQDFEICCYAEFNDLKKDDVHDIIEMVGGCIVQHPSMFSFDPSKRPVILVEDDNKKDCAALRKFHKMYDVPVVAKDWLLDSVGCFKLQKISEWAVDLNPAGRS